jgi:hypothetical protein
LEGAYVIGDRDQVQQIKQPVQDKGYATRRARILNLLPAMSGILSFQDNPEKKVSL